MKNITAIALAAFAVTASCSAPEPTGASYATGFDMKKSWANLSPYKEAESFGVPKGVPQNCELSQVHVLHRHAERYPTDYPLDGEGMQDFATKLTNYTKNHPGKKVASGPLSFLNNWKYVLGSDALMETVRLPRRCREPTSGPNMVDCCIALTATPWRLGILLSMCIPTALLARRLSFAPHPRAAFWRVLGGGSVSSSILSL